MKELVEVVVEKLPKCDICNMNGKDTQASFDAKINMGHGSWGSLCESCFAKYGIGLGTGRGQKYIVK